MNNFDVQKYYDYTVPFYKVFWHGESRGIHYGYFDDVAQDLGLALIRANEKMAEAAKITKNDKVVDLGCGVGGGVFWIAQNIGSHVTGVTLSGAQYKKARQLQKRKKLQEKTHFVQKNFFENHFEDASFDVVWGHEALCYGQYRMQELANELYRISKPGGRLVVADAYVGKEKLSESEKKDLITFYKGFALVSMVTKEMFISALEKAGFTNVKYVDWTKNILPTASHMHNLTKRWSWFIKLCVWLRLVPDLLLKNNETGIVQKNLFEDRALVYGCITATKELS